MAQSKLLDDDPMMVAWREYKNSDDYAVLRQWALKTESVDGSLWDAFAHGWFAKFAELKRIEGNQ